MVGDRASVVIVGGGVVGCGVAYFLARAGARVTLLERGPLCSEASSAAAGLTLTSTRDGFLLELAQRSIQILKELNGELDGAFELEERGSLTLLRTEDELAAQRAHVEKQRGRGMDIRLLDPPSALELEPSASPEIVGAAYCPTDSTANPYAMTLALGRAARRLGATIRTGVEVTSLKSESGRIRAAVTREGEVAGDVVVVAAGAWSPFLTRPLGLDIPVEPSRGQIMVTEPVPAIRRAIRDTGHIYLCPTRHGNLTIGSMTERVGFNKQVTRDRMQEYLTQAIGLVPGLRSVRIVRAWAGLRPL